MEELDYVVIVMRNIWTRRNAVSFDNKFDRPEIILQKAIMSLESFYFAQQLGLVQNANAVMVMRGLGQWRKPAEHYVKANWDAAVDIKSKTTGLGVIIRDAECEVQASLISALYLFSNLLLPKQEHLEWRWNSGSSFFTCHFCMGLS